MKTQTNMISMLGFGFMVAIGAILMAGCEYDVPITGSPTQKINDKLVGTWVSENEQETMKIRRFDDSTYVVSYNGQLFRAYHSDLDGTAFVSAEDIDWSTRKYCYRVWNLSEDGTSLTLQSISEKLVPRDIKDKTVIQALLRKNINNPDLFTNEIQFSKKD